MRMSLLDYKDGIFGQQIWECLATAAQEDGDVEEEEGKIEEEDPLQMESGSEKSEEGNTEQPKPGQSDDPPDEFKT